MTTRYRKTRRRRRALALLIAACVIGAGAMVMTGHALLLETGASGMAIGAAAGGIVTYRLTMRLAPVPKQVANRTRAPAGRGRRNGYLPPGSLQKISSMISPECMGREQCALCSGISCDCPCNHDPAAIAAWNRAHAAQQPIPDDDSPPF